jgi:hypothetical protein
MRRTDRRVLGAGQPLRAYRYLDVFTGARRTLLGIPPNGRVQPILETDLRTPIEESPGQGKVWAPTLWIVNWPGQVFNRGGTVGQHDDVFDKAQQCSFGVIAQVDRSMLLAEGHGQKAFDEIIDVAEGPVCQQGPRR